MTDTFGSFAHVLEHLHAIYCGHENEYDNNNMQYTNNDVPYTSTIYLQYTYNAID